MTKPHDFWCVLILTEGTDGPRRRPWTLTPFGNGKEFQYPIFPVKKEATSWAKNYPGRKKIVRCTVRWAAP